MKKKIISVMLITAMLTGIFPTKALAAAKQEPIGEKLTITIDENAEKMRMKEIATSGKNKVNIVNDGKTDFILIADKKANILLNDAVDTFCDVFNQMTGVDIQQQKGDSTSPSFRFDVKKGLDLNGGFEINITDNGVCVCSDTYEGVANGIYTFIEDKLGCMFLSPDYTYIPEQKTIWLEKEQRQFTPSIEWRDVYSREVLINNWSSKLKLNGINSNSLNITKEYVDEKQYNGWGTWCHSCYAFLSPDDYFDSHPEYFSEVDGVRVHEYEGREAYLCLSNPEVYEIVKNSLAEKIKENPDVMYWDFSGSDNPALAGCQCPECKKADEAAGGTGMGTLLPFLNKLAKEFPDKYISTLAYLHTLKAPTNIKAEPNVVIKLCSMPGDQASTYRSGKSEGALEFKTQVEEWNKVCEHIVVWDYVVNFANLLMPFPNFAVQTENQKFYEEHNVQGIFHQASREDGGEMACMRAYILSALMWEGSEMDIQQKMSRYISLYYGDAAPFVAEYMNYCNEALYNSCQPLGLYDGLYKHYKGYLSLDNINLYLKKIKDAEEAVKDDEAIFNRVEQIELSIQYAKMVYPDISRKERNKTKEIVSKLCEKYNVTMSSELESFDSFFESGLDREVKNIFKIVHKTQINICLVLTGLIIFVAAAGAVTAVVKKIKKKKGKNKKTEAKN